MDKEDWNIYPLPPKSTWDSLKNQPIDPAAIEDEESFDFAKCKIPAPHEYTFAMTDNGHFAVYTGESGIY